MFGIRRREPEIAVIPVPPPRLVKPRKAAVQCSVPTQALQVYESLSEEVGFTPAALKEAKLVAYLNSSGIGVYDYDEVSAYLTQELGRARTVDYNRVTAWQWCPLREVDWREHGVNGRMRENGDSILNRTYDMPVPIEALAIVRDINNAVPGNFFFVSDMVRDSDQRRTGDPFLMVWDEGFGKRYIVAQWDEPGFGGVKGSA